MTPLNKRNALKTNLKTICIETILQVGDEVVHHHHQF